MPKDFRVNGRHIWQLYFIVMLCFYTITLVQLAAQIIVVIYTGYIFVRYDHGRMTKRRMKAIGVFLLWYGLFFTYVYISKRWAYDTRADSKTIITLLRITVISVCLVYYMTSERKIEEILRCFVYSVLVMIVCIFVTTPFSSYGKEVIYSIGYHRNFVGDITAIGAFTAYYLHKYSVLRYGKGIIGACMTMCLLTGSRGGVLFACLFVFFSVLFERNLKKKAKYIILGVMTIFMVLTIAYMTPYLYNTYVVRIMNALGLGNAVDSSIKGRGDYRIIALMLFRQKPITGWGVDGFFCYLSNNPYISGYYMEANYSHCNYTEILADFGIVGIILYYSLHLKLLVSLIRKRMKSPLCNYALIYLLTIIVMDYFGITYETHMFIYLLVIAFSIIQSANTERIKIHDKIHSI